MKILKYIPSVLLLTVAFASSVLWEKHRVLETGPVQLTSPLTLTGEQGDSGQLPKGTVMYPYSHGPSYLYCFYKKNI